MTKSVSKSSMNCSFKTRIFDPTYLLYSSKVEVKVQPCSLRRQPIIVPTKNGECAEQSLLSRRDANPYLSRVRITRPVLWRPMLHMTMRG